VVENALYLPDGDRFVPTALTTGPWDPGAQHGGPPSALLARALERAEAPGPMALARLTVELLRPVPLRPLRVETAVLRPGKKVQLLGGSLLDGDVEVARAVGLRLRALEAPVPDDAVPGDRMPAGPDVAGRDVEPFHPLHDEIGFATDGNDLHFLEGGFDVPGPAAVWVRLRVPVVAGEATSGAMRAAAAADFGNGFSWVLPFDRWRFVNPDLTVHLARPPAGEWIGARSTTYPAGAGAGFAESALYDADGRVGRSVQSLLLEPSG
jgi:hypothetical protein